MALFCTNCGEKLEDSALFCTGCGQKTERPPDTAPPLATQQTSAAPLPGAQEMSAAPPPPAQPAKSGGSKLVVWLGLLVVLLGVTFGLAYVAYQRFVAQGDRVAAEVFDPFASEAPEPEVAEDEPPFGLAPPPDAEPDAESASRFVELDPPPAAAPAPTPAPRPAPVAPRPAATPKAPPAQRADPPPAARPEPEKPQQVAAAAPPPPAAPVAAPVPPPAAQSEPPPPKGGKVMLSGTDAYSPPPAPPATVPQAATPPPAMATAGDVFWSGTLRKNQTVTVDFSQGAGGVGGQPLPGKPVRLETFSPAVEIVELPGPENGWKRFTFKATREAKRSVTLNFRWTLSQ